MDGTQKIVFVIGMVLLIVVGAALILSSDDGAEETGEAESSVPETGEPDLTISTDTEMEAFLEATLSDEMEGVTVALAADVAAGTAGGTFCGDLVGNGYTIACEIATQGDGDSVLTWAALFLALGGSTVTDLTIAGTLGTAGEATYCTAGLCYTMWDCTLYNVQITADLNVGCETANSEGEIVSLGASAAVAIEADSCVFTSCSASSGCQAYYSLDGEADYDVAGVWLVVMATDCTFSECGCNATSGVFDEDEEEEES